MEGDDENTPGVLMRSMMSLCEGAKTKIHVDSCLSKYFKVKVGMNQRSMLPLFVQVWQMLSLNWQERVH